MIDEAIPRAIIRQAGLPNNSTLTPIGGGFSDATVWRVDCADGLYALKRYPAVIGIDHLLAIHSLMITARSAGIAALPAVQRFAHQSTVLLHSDAVWDITSWQPGSAALNAEPTAAQLAAAGAVLGRLHSIWAYTRHDPTPCPAILRRLAILAEGTTAQNPANAIDIDGQLRQAVQAHGSRMQSELARWTKRHVAVQACMCDCWHAHFLYTGDEVTGLIDHAAVQLDHPAVDLARLLGSLNLSSAARAALFDGYQRHRPLPLEELELISLLEQSGIVCSLIHWQQQIAKLGTLPGAAIDRIGFLLDRAAALN